MIVAATSYPSTVKTSCSNDFATTDSNISSAEVHHTISTTGTTAANACSRRSSGNGDLSAGNMDGSSVVTVTPANARTPKCTDSGDVAVGNNNCAPVSTAACTFITYAAASNAGTTTVSPDSFNCSTVDGDGPAISTFTASDACTRISTLGVNNSSLDGNGPAIFSFSPSNG